MNLEQDDWRKCVFALASTTQLEIRSRGNTHYDEEPR